MAGMICKSTTTLMSIAAANELAEGLTLEDDWKYVACHDPKGTGLSFVKIYDEDDIYVGNI